MKAGPDHYINEFLSQDMISSPHYRQDEKQASYMMQMRVDSRGSPLRRTFLGNLEHYTQGQVIKQRKDSNFKADYMDQLVRKQTSVKLAAGG